MKIIKFFVFTFILLLIFGGVWFYSMTNGEIWLVLNKQVAKDYASALLKGDVNYKTPDRFIDYVVTAENGYVLFSEHGELDRMIGYFPDNTPNANINNVTKFNWEKLEDNWYQAR